MCLTFEEVAPKLVQWGVWEFDNRGSFANLNESSNGKMYHVYLKTAACGGGNKTENYNQMPAEVAFVDAMLTKLEPMQKVVCDAMFVSDSSLTQWTIRARKEDAKLKITKKYKINDRKFAEHLKAFSIAVCTVLDTPKIDSRHPFYQDMCCHV